MKARERVRRRILIKEAQRLLDGEVGWGAITKETGKEISEIMLARIRKRAEKGLAEAMNGAKVRVEVKWDPERPTLVELVAHASETN